MKEIEEDTKMWKYLPCSWTGRINIVKMSIQTKSISRFNVMSIKITIIFIKLEKIHVEAQRTQNS
jgi:hypothetical protein